MSIDLIKVIYKLNLCLNISVLLNGLLRKIIVIIGLANVPFFIYVANFIKGKIVINT